MMNRILGIVLCVVMCGPGEVSVGFREDVARRERLVYSGIERNARMVLEREERNERLIWERNESERQVILQVEKTRKNDYYNLGTSLCLSVIFFNPIPVISYAGVFCFREYKRRNDMASVVLQSTNFVYEDNSDVEHVMESRTVLERVTGLNDKQLSVVAVAGIAVGAVGYIAGMYFAPAMLAYVGTMGFTGITKMTVVASGTAFGGVCGVCIADYCFKRSVKRVAIISVAGVGMIVLGNVVSARWSRVRSETLFRMAAKRDFDIILTLTAVALTAGIATGFIGAGAATTAAIGGAGAGAPGAIGATGFIGAGAIGAAVKWPNAITTLFEYIGFARNTEWMYDKVLAVKVYLFGTPGYSIKYVIGAGVAGAIVIVVIGGVIYLLYRKNSSTYVYNVYQVSGNVQVNTGV